MDTGSTPWWRNAICWQVYPLGFCGAPTHRPWATSAADASLTSETDRENVVHRLGRVTAYLDHLVALGANVLLLNPIFDSVSHGYDTLEHRRIDPRLGDGSDLADLITASHGRGIKVVLDGVFNHVSVHHPIVRHALHDGPDSAAGRRIRWAGAHPYGFEGNDDLVELDLTEPTVQDEIVGIMLHWLDQGIDGWRLDAMYAAGSEAWAPILEQVRSARPDAWLLGEVIHGDYTTFATASGADSITQYELWKAIWSSLRETNLFELAHAVGRHEEFLHGDAATASTRGLLPLTFLDNHDTTRIASQLTDGRDLAVACALLALLPGIPCIYAGDEFGAAAMKEDRAGGDDAVRPVFPDAPSAVTDGDIGACPESDAASTGGHFPALALLKPSAAPRILEVHRRLLALRRREPWLADARVHVDQDSLTNTDARIRLVGRDDPPTSLVLAVNLGDEDHPAGGEVLEQISGADVLDGIGGPTAGVVPAHGVAILQG